MSPVVYTLVVVPTTIVTVALFAVMARRLLGVRMSLLRLVIAGMITVQLAPVIATAIAGRDVQATANGTLMLFFVLGTAFALLAGLVFLVLAEAFVPTGSLPRPIDWIRGVRTRSARTRRYLQISRILVRHGLDGYVRGRWRPAVHEPGDRSRLARSVRLALDEGGVTFVKLGQVLSTRRDLLPSEFIDEFGRLQDQAATAPFDQVEQVVTEELGAPLDEVFGAFDPTPLAAASIAQVHAARLSSGENVVVKVQRADIQTTVERDLDILGRLTRTLQDRTRWARVVGAAALADGFAQALREELDFRVEARNMTAVAAAASDRGDSSSVRCPSLYDELSTQRVLVMERLDGVPLGTAGPVIAERGLNRHELARSLLDALLCQITQDGVFHADPHPGNVLLLTDNRLGLLDFGSVGRLDHALRATLQRFLLALDGGDPGMVADALLEIVERPDEVDEARLERSLGRFLATYMNAGGTVSDAQMFADLFRLVTRHGLAVPPEIAAVFRALGTAEGVLTAVAPDFDIIAETRRFASVALREQLRPENVRDTAAHELIALLPMLRRLPRRLDHIAGALESGRLSVNLRLLADERERRTVTGLLHQALLTVLAATAGVMALLLLGLPGGPAVTAAVSLYEVLGSFLLIVCGVLALRVLIVIFIDQRP